MQLNRPVEIEITRTLSPDNYKYVQTYRAERECGPLGAWRGAARVLLLTALFQIIVITLLVLGVIVFVVVTCVSCM